MCFFPTNFYSLFIFPNKIQLKVTIHYKNDGLSVDNHEIINNEKLKIFLLQLTNWLKLGFNPKLIYNLAIWLPGSRVTNIIWGQIKKIQNKTCIKILIVNDVIPKINQISC